MYAHVSLITALGIPGDDIVSQSEFVHWWTVVSIYIYIYIYIYIVFINNVVVADYV